MLSDLLMNLIPHVLDKVIPDPGARDAAKLELMKLNQAGDLAQLASQTDLAKGQQDINKVEAASSSFFVSGWRPFIGWVCGLGLLYQFILSPFLTWGAGLMGHAQPAPNLDMSTLLTLLLGMLGLGGLRTAEKIKGVS